LSLYTNIKYVSLIRKNSFGQNGVSIRFDERIIYHLKRYWISQL